MFSLFSVSHTIATGLSNYRKNIFEGGKLKDFFKDFQFEM